MSEDGRLHLNGRDIFAAADDDVLLTVHDVYVIFIVPDSHVAGVQPGAGHHGSRGFGLIVVAIHDVVAAHYDLADGFHIARHVVHLGVDYANFATGNRPAGHGLMAHAVRIVFVNDCRFFP